jgi:hypothetical protein
MSISNIDAQKSNFKEYQNKDYNVTIDYPSKWKKSENNLAQNQIVIFSAPEVEQKESSVLSFVLIPAKVTLASQQTPSNNMTLENFTNYFIDSAYSSSDEYKIIKTSRTTLAGNEAVELLMYDYVGDKTSKVKRVISLFDNDTAYMIKYAAEPGKFSKYLPVAQQMIDSFQPTTFLKNNITVANEATQEKKIPIEIPTTVPKSKNSYQLIIYLDNASPQNVIGDNFNILVYNSNSEPILSAKPNIDFNDDHQKISPPNGYPIIYQSGQYPKDIRVCAQQEYQLNGTTYLHNDCYPIIQNVQKTYWYTIFDYREIDGFEPDSQRISQEGLESNTQQNDFELPQILSFKRPGYDFIVPAPLIAVLDGGKVSLINDEKYPQKSTYLLTTYNPVLEFQFREGAKIPVVNIKQMMVGKIKSYNNSSDALKSSYLFENIGFNEKTVLPLQDDGFGYLVAEVQFANNISGIYGLGFENTPDDSNSPDYRKSVQEFAKQNGLTVVNSSSVNIRPDDTFQLVAQSVICHLTLSYGFQVCGDDSALQKKLTS